VKEAKPTVILGCSDNDSQTLLLQALVTIKCIEMNPQLAVLKRKISKFSNPTLQASSD